MTILFDGELYADHHQFYLADAADDPDVPVNWTDEAIKQRVLCADGAMVVSTARFETVPVRVELHDAEPQIAIDDADHVVTANLRSSGTIAIADILGYEPEPARASVPAGDLRVMVVFYGLGTISENGFEGDDRYVVHLWPGTGDGVTVLRQWDGP